MQTIYLLGLNYCHTKYEFKYLYTHSIHFYTIATKYDMVIGFAINVEREQVNGIQHIFMQRVLTK